MKKLKLVEKRGQAATGFTDVYTSVNTESPRAVVTVFYLPQFDDDSMKHAVVMVLLEKPKETWTKVQISEIMFDVESEIRKFENTQFKPSLPIKYCDFQLNYIDSIDGFLSEACGDNSFV